MTDDLVSKNFRVLFRAVNNKGLYGTECKKGQRDGQLIFALTLNSTMLTLYDPRKEAF